MAKANDYQSIIKLLEKSNIDHSSEVYIKTQDVSRKFKKFSGKQNKDFVELLTKSPIFPYHFFEYFYRLLKDSALEKFNVDELTVVDRAYLIIQLRAANIGNIIKIDNREIDLNHHIADIRDIELPGDKTIYVDQFEITLGFPTLKNENGFEKLLINEIDKFKMNDEKDHRLILSTIFLYNILSYVKSIKMTVGGDIVDFEFEQKTHIQKIEIGKTIASTVILGIAEEIENTYSPIMRQLVTHTIDDQDYSIDLTPNFFLE